MTARPRILVAVVGTATGVGKTWLAAHLLRQARGRGSVVAARKPVQSFDPREAERTDAHVLGATTGETPREVCPPHRWYGQAMAPPMAADALGLAPIALADLVDAIRWPAGVDLGVVETAGGLRSPVAHDGDSLALVDAVAPDHVAVVTDAALGAINATCLTVDLLGHHTVTVHVNRYDGSDDLHRRNLDWLSTHLPPSVTVTSHPDDIAVHMAT